MKNKIYIFTILFFNVTTLFAQAPNWVWARKAGGTNYEIGYAVAIDANSNAYAFGAFSSTTTSFGSTILSNHDSTGNSYDIFLVKYNSAGTALWARCIGGTSGDVGERAIIISASGQIYISGTFSSNSINFGNGISVVKTIGAGSNLFTAKYDDTGNIIWAKVVNGNCAIHSTCLAEGENGSVYISGHYCSDTIHFAGSTLSDTSGVFQFMLFKYDSLGNEIWAKSSHTNSGCSVDGFSICTDTIGNSYISGVFNCNAITFDNVTLSATNGSTDLFVVKYDSTGQLIWAKKFGGTGVENAIIKLSPTGGLYLAGRFDSPSINLGAYTLTNSGQFDIFIAICDTAGNVLFAKKEGSIFDEQVWDFDFDSSGNIYLTGIFNGQPTFGGITLNSIGGDDLFVLKCSTTGNVIWATSAGGNQDEKSSGIAANQNGGVYVTGYYASTSVMFGSLMLSNFGFNSWDYFLAKLDNTTGTFTPFTSSNTINIFPNPASGQITITSPDIITQIKITNTLGQLIYQAKPDEKNVNVRLLNEGLFFVAVTTETKTETRKIIIQH